MDGAVFWTVAAGGFVAALLHAALPTHWLPFVLVGRAQGWSGRRTLAVTALAGSGHIIATVALAVLLTGAGMALEERYGPMLRQIAGAVLIGFGLLYLLRRPPEVAGAAAPPRRVSDLAAVLGLVGVLALSPGETFGSVLLAGQPYGWAGFVVLSLVLAAATLLGMLLFTGASWMGAAKLKLDRAEKLERRILGAALCGLGVLVLVLPH
jgi:threonine/homoserine/homoserine lactone efflux protein